MLNRSEPACLVIADITGYTSYLAGVELDHAQDILADLVDTVVGALRPPFKLAKLEGDAAFTYVITETLDASALMDIVERTYIAFRRRLRDISQASVCDCNACIRMPTLDLKILAHHGTILRQRVAGREELVGSPVIVAHRLLKNAVNEATGIAAYALYTDDCLAAAGVADPKSLGLVEHRETYETIGEVTTWVGDLDAAWNVDQTSTRVVVDPKETFMSFGYDMPAPPALTWEYLTSPARRPRWQTDVTEVIEATAGGRRGVGTTNHCVHGKDAVVEEILDWRPPEYLTVNWRMPIPQAPKIRMMETLTEIDGGTHVETRMARPRSAKDRAFLEVVLAQLKPGFVAGRAALADVLAAEMARRAAESESAPEPVLPSSAGRFLEVPVDSGRFRSS